MSENASEKQVDEFISAFIRGEIRSCGALAYKCYRLGQKDGGRPLVFVLPDGVKSAEPGTYKLVKADANGRSDLAEELQAKTAEASAAQAEVAQLRQVVQDMRKALDGVPSLRQPEEPIVPKAGDRWRATFCGQSAEVYTLTTRHRLLGAEDGWNTSQQGVWFHHFRFFNGDMEFVSRAPATPAKDGE